MNIQELFEGIKKIFEPFLQERAVTEVDEWNGSASNYSSTDEYCSACLIDVNSAAGRDTKAQSHCMLPVKPPGSNKLEELIRIYRDTEIVAGTCKMCNQPIRYIGPYWEHLGELQPHHPAWPK